MFWRRRRAIGAALTLLASFVVACSTLLGLEETTLQTRDGGDIEWDAAGKVPPRLDGSAHTGTLDPTFGDGGVVVVPTTLHGPPSVLADGDEVVVIVPSERDGNTDVLRFSKTGAFDPLRVARLSMQTDSVNAIAVMLAPRGDGVLVYSRGYQDVPDGGKTLAFELSRVSRVGGVETYWTYRGESQNLRSAAALARTATGAVVVDVRDLDGPKAPYTVRLHAFRSDGSVDGDFGEGGVASFTAPLRGGQNGDAVGRTDGTIVFASDGIRPVNTADAATVDAASTTKALWLRFNANGIIDDTFGPDGGVAPFEHGVDIFGGSLAADDGGYVVGGFTVPTRANGNNAIRGYLLRVTNEGRLDPSFWDAGIYDFGDRSHDERNIDWIRSIVVLRDGSIIALGITAALGGASLAGLVHVNRNGLDRSFGEDGILFVDRTSNPFEPRSVAVQDDGRLLVCWQTNDDIIKVARYIVQ